MSWLTSILRNILTYIGLHTWLGWLPSLDDLYSLAWLNVHFFNVSMPIPVDEKNPLRLDTDMLELSQNFTSPN